MRYNVGDRVRIKSIDWYNKNKDNYGSIHVGNNFYFWKSMARYCGEIMKITNIKVDPITNKSYYMIEDGGQFYWIDEMIECKVEDETKPKFKVGDKVIIDPYPCVVTDVNWRDSLHGFVYTVRGFDFGKMVGEEDLVLDERTVPNTNEIIQLIKNDWNNFKDRYDIPDDYHFVDKNGNEINISEIVLEKKKKEYPETYKECCKVMNYCCNPVATKITHKEELIRKFQFLLLYRDAINFDGKRLEKDKGYPCCNMILIFPTEEMRDAFYENFKEEIEICKELL